MLTSGHIFEKIIYFTIFYAIIIKLYPFSEQILHESDNSAAVISAATAIRYLSDEEFGYGKLA